MPHPSTTHTARTEREFDPRVPGVPGDGSPVVLHVDAERGLTYTWFDISRRRRDWISRERGYLVSRLVITDAGDREVGYLNITHTTPELVTYRCGPPLRPSNTWRLRPHRTPTC